MSDASLDIFAGLPASFAIAGVVAAACAYAVAKAFIDRRKPDESTPPQIPTWAMMGPVHEVMQTIHDMAEEARKTNTILVDIAKTMRDVDKGQEYTHRILESVLNHQEMRAGFESMRRHDIEEDSSRDTRNPRGRSR